MVNIVLQYYCRISWIILRMLASGAKQCHVPWSCSVLMKAVKLWEGDWSRKLPANWCSSTTEYQVGISWRRIYWEMKRLQRIVDWCRNMSSSKSVVGRHTYKLAFDLLSLNHNKPLLILISYPYWCHWYTTVMKMIMTWLWIINVDFILT